MTNKNKIKFSPLFPNKPPTQKESLTPPPVGLDQDKPAFHSLDHRYQTGDASTILFLSKRGMSRSPLAREVLREKISQSLLWEVQGFI